MTVPVPNTGPAKFLWAGGGLLGGAGAAFGVNKAFVTPERDKELTDERGTTRWNSAEARYKVMAGSFGVATGLALGLAKRGGSTGLTTATHIATGALLSSVVSGLNKPDEADSTMQNLSFMLGGVGLGALASVRDEAMHLPLRNMSLGFAGVAIGMMAPSIISGLTEGGGDLLRGVTEK